jgi:hypothetical protein
MAVFGDEEYTLTDIAEYVNRMAARMEQKGITLAQAQRIIDGYGHIVVDEWIEGTPSNTLADYFLELHRTRVPMQKPKRSLFDLSRYVALVIIELVNFGVSMEDALDTVDDFDEVIVHWYPMVAPRTAARRLVVMNRRVAAGLAAHEVR